MDGIYNITADIRTDDQTKSTMAVNVVHALLCLTLCHKDRGARPKRACRDRLDDLTQGQIVVGNHCLRHRVVWLKAHRVVRRQRENNKVRKIVFFYKAVKCFKKNPGSDYIRHIQREGRILRFYNWTHC